MFPGDASHRNTCFAFRSTSPSFATAALLDWPGNRDRTELKDCSNVSRLLPVNQKIAVK